MGIVKLRTKNPRYARTEALAWENIRAGDQSLSYLCPLGDVSVSGRAISGITTVDAISIHIAGRMGDRRGLRLTIVIPRLTYPSSKRFEKNQHVLISADDDNHTGIVLWQAHKPAGDGEAAHTVLMVECLGPADVEAWLGDREWLG